MLTTTDEFIKRNVDEMNRFTARLQGEPGGKEFLASIPNDFRYRDELIYEEFIRHNHPRRIAAAILDSPDHSIGDISRIANVLRPLFTGLKGKALSDLALICESHHSSDLHDLAKYPVRSVHGQAEQAQINVHALSILLRSADILQIGTGRTPSVSFSLVNPSNPISYLHWTKEMGVNRVTGEINRSTDPTIPNQYRVLLFGFFDEAEPFFALMNHVRYATAELRRCANWSALAASTSNSFRFRWSEIDTTDVEAHGFERDQFSFQIDREKILNLLIGHTLYNDTRVVLRELVQNSIDAVRLQDHQHHTANGHVHASIDSENRKLTVTDNGTGMTADTITRHLLTVGSSFYSSEEFGRSYPDFAPISRFGIGILTSFMVADEIEILTSHPSDDVARRISINGPSGTYLIKLVDKKTLATTFNGANHGTSITLTIRANSRQIRLVPELKYWFGFPGCRLTASEQSQGETSIGHSHPFDMLQEGLKRYFDQDSASSKYFTYEVIKGDEPGLFQAAYIVRTSKYSGRQFIVRASEMSRRTSELSDVATRAGIFLQGVRVESGSAGFRGDGPLAIVNGIGRGVPRTNVARSGIEQGDAQRRFFSAIYGLYIKFARERTRESQGGTIASITRDGRNAFYAYRQFDMSQAADPELLQAALDGEKAIVIEEGGKRRLASREEFITNELFVTVDSPFFRNAEALIEKLPHSKSLNDIIKALELADAPLPEGVLLCAPSLHLDSREMETLTIENLGFSRSPQQLVVTWRRIAEASDEEMLLRYFTNRQQAIANYPVILAPKSAITKSDAWHPDTLLITDYCVIVHPDSVIADNLKTYFVAPDSETTLTKAERQAVTLSIVEMLTQDRYHSGRSVDDLAREYAQRHSGVSADVIRSALLPFQNLTRVLVSEDERE
ncbi:ATP-binding protein [Kaistia sp. UC242_56]|uniref:HD domain-containing protein n=1 Tax=Kaistia sp. UC242_56 TaxID=3374625 RepID=UPI00378B22E3